MSALSISWATYSGDLFVGMRVKVSGVLPGPRRLTVQASTSLSEGGANPDEDVNEVNDTAAEANASLLTLCSSLKRLPQGVKDSVEAVGPPRYVCGAYFARGHHHCQHQKE